MSFGHWLNKSAKEAQQRYKQEEQQKREAEAEQCYIQQDGIIYDEDDYISYEAYEQFCEQLRKKDDDSSVFLDQQRMDDDCDLATSEYNHTTKGWSTI